MLVQSFQILSQTFLADQTEKRGHNNPLLDWFIVQQDVAADATYQPQRPAPQPLFQLHKQTINPQSISMNAFTKASLQQVWKSAQYDPLKEPIWNFLTLQTIQLCLQPLRSTRCLEYAFDLSEGRGGGLQTKLLAHAVPFLFFHVFNVTIKSANAQLHHQEADVCSRITPLVAPPTLFMIRSFEPETFSQPSWQSFRRRFSHKWPQHIDPAIRRAEHRTMQGESTFAAIIIAERVIKLLHSDVLFFWVIQSEPAMRVIYIQVVNIARSKISWRYRRRVFGLGYLQFLRQAAKLIVAQILLLLYATLKPVNFL